MPKAASSSASSRLASGSSGSSGSWRSGHHRACLEEKTGVQADGGADGSGGRCDVLLPWSRKKLSNVDWKG